MGMEPKIIQVVCVRDFPGIGGVIFKVDKLYLGREYWDRAITIEYDNINGAHFTNGEKDSAFKTHFKFFTG
jgi:hypothetical protein